MKLERIVPGSRLSGIAGGGAVEVVATRSCGPDAVDADRFEGRFREAVHQVGPVGSRVRKAEAV